MWDVNYNAILEDVKKINEDASTLIDLLQKDYEADENDYTFDYTLSDDSLTIDLDDCNYEVWKIYKVKRN